MNPFLPKVILAVVIITAAESKLEYQLTEKPTSIRSSVWIQIEELVRWPRQ